MNKKFKLLMIGDHPFSPSGVGNQFFNVIEHLQSTGKFSIRVFGAAIKHEDYRAQKVGEWDDTIIIPVDGYGSKDLLRQAIDLEKPDAIWIFTDPRFYYWLFEIADEVKQQCPIIYWHLWDNSSDDTWPEYNTPFYNATDKLVCINKLTYDFLAKHGWKDKSEYLPHGVKEDIFKPLSKEEIASARKKHAGFEGNEFVLFYNSRNAMRKRTNNVLYAFKEFLNLIPEEERKDCFMLMKTPPHDPEGSDLFKVMEKFNLQGRIAFCDKKVDPNELNEFYNLADMTISLSSEEGFGLSILESLMVNTPVVCTRTGGMQDQAIDPETGKEFGFCIEPSCRSIIGSQSTPYIFSDHVDPLIAAEKIHELYRRKKLHGDHKEFYAGGARENMLRRFNLKYILGRMEQIIEDEIIKYRKNKDERCVNVATI